MHPKAAYSGICHPVPVQRELWAEHIPLQPAACLCSRASRGVESSQRRVPAPGLCDSSSLPNSLQHGGSCSCTLGCLLPRVSRARCGGPVPRCREVPAQQQPADGLHFPGVFSFRIARFSNVHHLSMHFPKNFGAETTKIFYIGLKGEWMEVGESRENTTLLRVLKPALDHSCGGEEVGEVGGSVMTGPCSALASRVF